ncbi:RDD family protein [compost metagenome]
MEAREFRITDEMLATQGQRFLNYVIDLIIQYVIIFALGTLFSILSLLTGYTGILEWIGSMGDLEGYLVFFFIMILYYTLFESLCSRTIGKFITKTIVVNEDGSKPDSQIILRRTLCRLIPFDGLSFLGSGRGWHDSITDTYVVDKRLLDEKMQLLSAFDQIGKDSEV